MFWVGTTTRLLNRFPLWSEISVMEWKHSIYPHRPHYIIIFCSIQWHIFNTLEPRCCPVPLFKIKLNNKQYQSQHICKLGDKKKKKEKTERKKKSTLRDKMYQDLQVGQVQQWSCNFTRYLQPDFLAQTHIFLLYCWLISMLRFFY